VDTTAGWTTRRKLFLFETLIFLACIIGAIVFEVTGHGSSHALKGAVFFLVVLLVHIVLRLTYFKSVLPEIRQQRRNERSE
jgi:predicted Na+-dependent transporter